MNGGAPAQAGDWRPTATLARLRLRAKLLARVRDYFAGTGALEVETPALVRAAVTDVHLESLRVVDDAECLKSHAFQPLLNHGIADRGLSGPRARSRRGSTSNLLESAAVYQIFVVVDGKC